MARFIMAETAPVTLYWGPSHAVIYNEAYIPLVGGKHPSAMGRNASEVFPDFWDDYFVGVIQEMSQTGKTATGEETRLLMERHGYLEETFFTWKLVPIIGDDGTFLGAYGTADDSTTAVIGQRRTKCIQNLTQRLAKTTSFRDLWQLTVEGFAQNDRDIPFALLYCDVESLKFGTPPPRRKFEVVGSLGVPESHPLRSECVDLDADSHGFSSAIREAVSQMRTVVISSESTNIAKSLSDVQWKGVGVPCKQLAVVPVSSGSKIPAAVVIGINPYRRYNSWYQQFLEMISDVLASSMSKIYLSRELEYRAEIASRNARDAQRTEMRFSRFAARSTVGFAVTDLTGNVSKVGSGCTNATLTSGRFFSLVRRGTTSMTSIPRVRIPHGRKRSSRKICLSWQNGGTKLQC